MKALGRVKDGAQTDSSSEKATSQCVCQSTVQNEAIPFLLLLHIYLLNAQALPSFLVSAPFLAHVAS